MSYHCRLVSVIIHKKSYDVLLYLEEPEDGGSLVMLRAMADEFYLEDNYAFTNRDAARNFMRNATVKYLVEELLRLAPEVSPELFN